MAIKVAKVRLQTALMLARDIQAHNNGDKSRFDRMVNNQGKNVITRQDAVRIIARILDRQDVIEQYPATRTVFTAWLKAVTK